nr:hypothetical protein [Tanacetum cinerariifolium]
ARIAQPSALSPIANEPASPMRDVSQGKACPTDFGFVADQDRANIAKTSTLSHESTSRVTSLAADEGEGINLSGDDAPIKGRRLDEEEVATERVSSDTEEIRLDEGEVAAEKVSDDTKEMAIVLIIMDAASVLSNDKIAKIYAKEELQQMIEGLNRSNETIAKNLEEYEQAAAELTI